MITNNMMKRIITSFLFTLMALVLPSSLWADTVTYAIQENESHASGDVVEVKNGDDVVATLTFGFDGGEAFKAAKKHAGIEGFVAFTEGNGVNGSATAGTVYIVVPKYNGTIEAGVVLNAKKSFYVLEDDVALSDYNGITVTDKYYGSYSFDVKANKTYKIYCTGSKLGFYGIKYTYEPSSDPYIVDFNTPIATNNHDFAVASNWGHIVGSNNYDGYGPYYMAYSYAAEDGVDGSGALRVLAQNGYYSGSPQSEADFTDGSYDYLITPRVNGTVTLQVKGYNVTNYGSYVKIFKVDDTGTTVGEELTTEITPAITTSEWSTLSLNLTEETRLAIRAQSVILDNFTATSATIVKMPAMTIASLKRVDNETTTYFDQNADGTYNVKYKVKITNSGEVALVAGTTENYSLSVSIDNVVYGSFNVPVDLAVGATSDEFEVSVAMPDNAPTGWKYRYLKENLSGTSYTGGETYSNVLVYDPKPFFIKKGNEPIGKGRTLTAETSVNFGMISEATTQEFVVFANNAGDLQVKSIVAPEGFTVTPAETLPYTITAHTGMLVDITAAGTASAEGNLVITYVDKNGADATVEVALSQTVIDASKWIADFADNIWPDNTVHQSSLSIASSSYFGYDCAVKSGSATNNKFITPKLHATTGETFTFESMLDYSSGSVKVYLTTDRAQLGEPVFTLTSEQLSTTQLRKFTVTAAEEGDYYVVFEINKAFIDNLYGFEKVAVDHDIMVNTFILSGVTAEDKTIQSGETITSTFEILPVQSESADSYTVKIYAKGEETEAVATAESVDLVAGTTKRFTFESAPEASQTATFECWAQIEFTDGTIVKSASLNLTVTNEPVFVFFNKDTQVYSYKPSNRSAAIDFGIVSEPNQVQNFEIYNYGTAPLTVSSITVPEGFTVNVTEAVVQPKQRQAVDITFAATTPGVYGDSLVIAYTDGTGEQIFKLAVTGRMLDQNLWYASFDGTTDAIQWPAGSIYQNNINNSYHGSYSDHNYHIYTGFSTTDNKFITPKLEAAAGDVFSLDIAPYSTSYDGSVKVYLSADRENWGEPIATIDVAKAANYSATSIFVTNQVTIPEAGQYYIAVEPSYACVDNLYGLTLVNVAHDLAIAAVSIPAEAMQNVQTTATVSIQNFGFAEEAADAYTATLYVEDPALDDDVAAGTGVTVALPLNHKTNEKGMPVTIPFRYPKAGPFYAYIEVKAGDYSVRTEVSEINFAEEVAVAGVQVGTKSTTSSSTPFYTSWMDDSEGKSMSDFIYTPEQLAASGISAGDKIISITFSGTPTGTKTINSLTSEAWIAQQAVADFTAGSPDKENMSYVTLHNAEEVTFTSGTPYEFKIDLVDNPIVYDGTSGIRIFTNINGGGQYQTINFDVDGNYQNAYYAHGSGAFSSKVGNPVAFFGLEASVATLAGTVKDTQDAAVEGATVTLVSADGDNVQYTGTTDAEGAYTINVIQATRNYNVTVVAEGYEDGTATVEFGGESKTQDFTLQMPKIIEAVPLDVAAGWQQITELPANLADYYFAIADETQNLMLSLARGKHQDGAYNGLYYKTGANALIDKSMLFTLEANGDNVVMTNAEYNNLMLQTEWNAAWYYRTHDNGGGNKDWGNVRFTYSDAARSWTIQNGMYFVEDGNYLGVWNDDQAPANGLELALNKPATMKGVYRIFAIAKSDAEVYYAGLKAVQGDEPVDMTALIVNPNANFWTGTAPFGWTTTGTQNVNTGNGPDDFPGFFEYSNWGADSWNGSLQQTIEVPNGIYEVKAAFMAADGVTAYLTANSEKSENLDLFGADPRFPATLSVQATVTNGQLTIGAYAEANGKFLWVNTDNFTLTYLGALLVAGDANQDGIVTTGDAVAAVNFALEKEIPSEKAFEAADVNKSGKITVSDVVGIINIALDEELDARNMDNNAVNFLTMNGAEMSLSNTTAFVGFQMDVTLAQGAVLNGIELTDRAAGMRVAYNRVADNTYRIIAFSADKTAIMGSEGAIFSFNIAGDSNIKVSNAEFTDAAARAYALELAGTTGINSIVAGTVGTEVYNLGGVKSNKVRKGMNVVRGADGKMKKVFVK